MNAAVPVYYSVATMTEMCSLETPTEQASCVYNEAWLPSHLSDSELVEMANALLAPFPMGVFVTGCVAFLEKNRLLLDGYRRLAMVFELVRGDRLAYSLETRAFTADFDSDSLKHVPSQVLLDNYKLYHQLKTLPEDSRLHLEGLSSTIRHYKGFYALPCLINSELAKSLDYAPLTPQTPEEELALAATLRATLKRR